MNYKRYPLHDSFVNSLRSVDALLLADRFFTRAESLLGTSRSGVLICVGLASTKGTFTFDQICEKVKDLSKDRVKRILKELISQGIVLKHPNDDDHGFVYHTSARSDELIASITKGSLG